MSNDDGIWEDEVTRAGGYWYLDFVIDSSFRLFVIDPARDWLLAEGLCEIPPVDARLLSARPRRVPAVRDLDLNCSQAEKEKTLMQVEQKMTAVS
jgi:hypothetical protein